MRPACSRTTDLTSLGFATGGSGFTLAAWLYIALDNKVAHAVALNSPAGGKMALQVTGVSSLSATVLAYYETFTDGGWSLPPNVMPYASVAVNAWQHIAVTVSETSKYTGVSLYVNGKVVTIGSNTPTTGTPRGWSSMVVGASLPTTGGYTLPFDGSVKGLKLVSYALSAAQVFSMAITSTSPPYPPVPPTPPPLPRVATQPLVNAQFAANTCPSAPDGREMPLFGSVYPPTLASCGACSVSDATLGAAMNPYAGCCYNTDFTPSASWTVSIWIRATNNVLPYGYGNSPVGAAYQASFMATTGSCGGNCPGIVNFGFANGRVFGSIGNALGTSPITVLQTAAFAGNGWNNYVFTYDQTTLQLYVNGAVNATSAGTASAPLGPLFVGCGNGDSRWVVGGASYANKFLLNKLRMYDYALSAAEVANVYTI